VSGEQSHRIAVAFARAAARPEGSSLCLACADLLGVSGVGIALMGGTTSGPLCASNALVTTLEDLQFTLGEGPTLDAFRTRTPVVAPQLDDESFTPWPTFIERALIEGAHAIFSYPLTLARSTIGAITIYERRPGDLTPSQRSDCVAVTDVLTHMVLSMQGAAEPGTVAVGLGDAVAHRADVHQASGMVAVQLTVPVAEALARIRAYAYANDEPVSAVAADIVARRLRLHNDRKGGPTP
jgi:hypothetical protein